MPAEPTDRMFSRLVADGEINRICDAHSYVHLIASVRERVGLFMEHLDYHEMEALVIAEVNPRRLPAYLGDLAHYRHMLGQLCDPDQNPSPRNAVLEGRRP
jgi:hypothetical protein